MIRCEDHSATAFAAPTAAQTEHRPATDGVRPGQSAVPIAVSGVSFGYHPAKPVLHELDLFIPAGQLVALVGASGAGKSTLAALIAGVGHPTSGRILVGGVDTRTKSDQDQALVALITQEVHTFAGTLRADLTLACPLASGIEIFSAWPLSALIAG